MWITAYLRPLPDPDRISKELSSKQYVNSIDLSNLPWKKRFGLWLPDIGEREREREGEGGREE